MSEKKANKRPPLENGLLQAAHAIDNQVARAMQRSPEKRDAHGVQKWEPYAERIEHVASLLVSEFGDQGLGLDSLLVLAQGCTKALYILSSELGEDGLGDVRAQYCREAFASLLRDAERGEQLLKVNTTPLN